MSTFAVLDLETTGLFAGRHDRIVEIGIVLVDETGDEIESWATLVNPMQDIGATEVHGITAADLFAAPKFEDIAGHVIRLLQGRVLVTHNLPFDTNFLAAEFARIGLQVPVSRALGLCTMQLAGHYIDGVTRRLADCCEAIGYSIEHAHSALDDAKAASQLLAFYLQQDPNFLAEWSEIVDQAQTMPWPKLAVKDVKPVTRSEVGSHKNLHFLSRLASKVPRDNIYPAANNYLAVIDKVLMDRFISLHEEAELIQVAEAIGLSQEEALHCHYRYLISLAQMAKRDGIVTDNERADLLLVAKLLGLTNSDVDDVLAADAAEETAGTTSMLGFQLGVGDGVVITGTASDFERSDLEAETVSRGLRLLSSVSKKTRLVAAGDPDSLSGKARKARDLGIPIISFSCYASMLAKL